MELNATLLKAIVTDPDADEPRLAYAAWCDGHPAEEVREQGGYIRAAVELAHLPLDPGGGRGRRGQLVSDVNEYELEYGEQWAQEYRLGVQGHSFHRGFIELVALSAKEFLGEAAELISRAPVRHLKLMDAGSHAEELSKCATLGRVRSLDLAKGGLDDESVRWLATSPHLGELRWLSLAHNTIGMQGAEYLAESNALPNLAFVNFAGNSVKLNEEYSFDNGQVIEAGLPRDGHELESKFGYLPWIHHDATSMSDVVPCRFSIETAADGRFKQ